MVQLNPAYGHLLNQKDIPLTRAFSIPPPPPPHTHTHTLSVLTGLDSTCDEPRLRTPAQSDGHPVNTGIFYGPLTFFVNGV